MEKAFTYKDAGVDIDLASRFVEAVKALAQRVQRPWVLGGIGGFSAAVRIPEGYREPVLLSTCDGVGTKLKVAQALRRYDTVGIDLVAMCVNDLLPLGGKPLFFLDYLATGRLDPERDVKLLEGVVRGCEEASCPLVGGETAEMPGLYQEGDFDLVGFAVGVVEASKLVDGRDIKEGDIVIGLGSSGLHSNGFSLVRKVLEEKGMAYDAYVESLGTVLGEELLRPTRIYVKVVLELLGRCPIKGMAHITGGGLPGNLPRVLPKGLGIRIVPKWEIPPIFGFIESLGVPREEMWRVFNMGVGFALIVAPDEVDHLLRDAQALGEKAFVIGEVVRGEGVAIDG